MQRSFRVLIQDEATLSLRQDVIHALDRDDAVRQASAPGLHVVNCSEFNSSLATRIASVLTGGLKKKRGIDTIAFSQDMATLLEAGVTVKEAISALTRQETSAGSLMVLRDVNARIGEGKTLSQALLSTRAFPELLVKTVEASEKTGDLVNGLGRYAKHQRNLLLVRDRVVGAAVYPMLLLVIGAIVVAMLLGVVVPRFSALIEGAGKELPLMSKILMGWGRFAAENAWVPWTLFGTLAAALFAGFVYLRDANLRKALLQRIPVVAKVVREFQHLQMYRTTAILTSRGIPIHAALPLSMEFLNAEDQTRLQNALEKMRTGLSVSAAMTITGLADIVAASMLAVAENSGSMPEMLERIASFYERTLERNIELASKLIEPVLMIIFGVVIGGIVVLMYLPIFDLASSIA